MPADRRHTVLILARSQATADDVGTLVRSTGCIALFPKPDQGALAALFHLRPDVVMLERGREEEANERFHAITGTIGAGVVLFGEESPELRETAKTHGYRSVAISAPARAFGFAIEEAAGA